MIRLVVLLVSALVTLASCSPGRFYRKELPRQIRQSTVFQQSATGFILMDPANGGRILCAVNGDKLFTPASNTKILTLYTALHFLGDTLPTMLLAHTDSVDWVIPVGDPTFLHPLFRQWQSGFDGLKNSRAGSVRIWNKYGEPERWGPGWAWDDFMDDYSAERSAMPLYGNVSRVFSLQSDSLGIEPPIWQPYLKKGVTVKNTLESAGDNHLIYNTQARFPADFEQWIPVSQAGLRAPAVLQDALHKPVGLAVSPPPATLRFSPQYATPADTVYRRLMHQSDNFIAEQLLLMCAREKFDTLQEDRMIRWMTDSLWYNLPQSLRWVDGSGLSRYNLNSPHNIAEILRRLYQEQPFSRLQNLFPAGGVSGTLSDWYKGAGNRPYVYAKSGSMGGVYCLSGYLINDKGKVLIFSIMNNNFVGPIKPWKQEIQRILNLIKEGS